MNGDGFYSITSVKLTETILLIPRDWVKFMKNWSQTQFNSFQSNYAARLFRVECQMPYDVFLMEKY